MPKQQKNQLVSMQRAEIKQLRADARKLDVVAKHLRQRAKEIAHDVKFQEKADRAGANFFSKESSVMPGTRLDPDITDFGSIV